MRPDRVVDDVPHYSTDLTAGMDVFLHMNRGQPWEVWERFNTALGGMVPSDPEAICHAALRAVGMEVKDDDN